MRSLLLIFVFSLVINSQARSLTENRDHQLGGISRKLPLRATGVVDYNGLAVLNPGKPGFIEMINGYGRDKPKRAPPAPKEAPPTHQVSGLGNLGKEGGEEVPPPPHHAPPTHQVTGGGVVAQENYGKEGGHLAPPPPHPAPPTHQVSGGRAAEMEESWAAYVLLSASA
ncbi:hypothetical protein SASPL_128741 [Salvia splendens]|uniref:Uncharacterized protein n=1 Tax=Salvia splendens TaxID=180675 RepID=A0A8X8XBK1_SALSN|nr:uncharacterized protein LOC121751357 [Salvia splendens]KAG6410676.1 hypothetical protein SASPL_128741 [Salvia splendens]